MHVDEVLCHGENGGATWETSNRGCIMRKDVSKEVTAGGRFAFFLDSGLCYIHATTKANSMPEIFGPKCMEFTLEIKLVHNTGIIVRLLKYLQRSTYP